MDTYYTIEEKYLQAIDELNYGEVPKSLKLLNEILAAEPLYAQAHYQIGCLYYYNLDDYKTAGYHFKTCTELAPEFPDVYFHYISLMVFLNLETMLGKVAERALLVPGVSGAAIYNQMAICCENNRKWELAKKHYETAAMLVIKKRQREEIEESLERIKAKMDKRKAYLYTLSDND